MSCARCPRAGRPCAGESNERLCQLVDPQHPDHRPEYLSALEPKADDPPPAPARLVPVGAAMEAQRRGYANCDRSTTPSCGCSPPVCEVLGRAVSLLDCIDCLGIS